MLKKYIVSLSETEINQLKNITKKGKHSARTIIRAKVLIEANSGKKDNEIIKLLDLSKCTPQNIRKRYYEGGIKKALYDAPRTGQPRITNTKEEAEIIAIACSDPDDGNARWTLDLLMEKAKEKLTARKKPLGRTTIYNILLKSDLKPWREKNVMHS